MSKKIPKKKKVNAAAEGGGGMYMLQLFVTGILPNAARAIENVNAVCVKYLEGRYELEIIDIYQQPALAVAENISAVPLLIKKFPLPEERLIGDLSNMERVLKGLHLS